MRLRQFAQTAGESSTPTLRPLQKWDRRLLLKNLMALAGATSSVGLAGCDELVEAFLDTCPDGMPGNGGISWSPDVLHPVTYGVTSYSPDGESGSPPAALRIYYPALRSGAVNQRPILKQCVVRWPVVLWLHGQEPRTCSDRYRAHMFRIWGAMAKTLARSGYVVVAPQHTAGRPDDSSVPEVSTALSVLDWVRESWEHREWVHQDPAATAVVGHSFGAVLATHVARARPEISAYVGLSGTWDDSVIADAESMVTTIGAPSLFTWSNCSLQGDHILEDLDRIDNLWEKIPAPKHGLSFSGEHFDYVYGAVKDWCEPAILQGPGTHISTAISDVIALFLSRTVPIQFSNPEVPVSLEAPDVFLTAVQEQYAGSHLSGLPMLSQDDNCNAVLKWQEGSTVGSRLLGPSSTSACE